MSQQQQVEIEGYVTLKRKNVWVKRYANVCKEGVLTYKKQPKDPKIKMSIKLKGANVMFGQRDNQDLYIYIKT